MRREIRLVHRGEKEAGRDLQLGSRFGGFAWEERSISRGRFSKKGTHWEGEDKGGKGREERTQPTHKRSCRGLHDSIQRRRSRCW